MTQSQTSSEERQQAAPAVHLNIVMTLLLLVGTAGFMAILFSLYRLTAIGMPIFGLLFLLYWAALLKQDSRTYVPSIIGGLLGIALGWLLVVLPGREGPVGSAVSFAAMGVTLFCYMSGRAARLINNATMLFLAVSTIPELRIADNGGTMALSLILGAAYMGLVSWVVHLIMKCRA